LNIFFAYMTSVDVFTKNTIYIKKLRSVRSVHVRILTYLRRSYYSEEKMR